MYHRVLSKLCAARSKIAFPEWHSSDAVWFVAPDPNKAAKFSPHPHLELCKLGPKVRPNPPACSSVYVCSITGWPEQFVRELSFGLGADNSFFDHPEYPGWPIIDLPIQKRPFIEIDGRFYCFDYYSFVDNFYRTIQKTVSRLDKEYNWNAVQKEASENMVAGLFQRLLPGCTVYANNYYPKGKSKKQLCESDLLVIYFGVAIIVEVKAGSFVYTAPLVDYEQHIKSYKKLIEEPDLQCKRTYDYLLANDAAVFYTESGEEKAQIDVSTLSDIYMLSVTIDNINEFASKAEKLSFLKLQCEAISLSVDDLMVYAHYFESPLKFLHFLKQRRAATKVAKLATNDELDHLGLYIKHECCRLIVNQPEGG